MKISDMISMCFGNLFRRKMRTLLTIIGVVVGTCAIVVMISLGLGMTAAQEAMLANMGDLTVIEVFNYGYSGEGEPKIMDDDAIAAMARISGVDVATPIYSPNYLQASIYSGKKERYRLQTWNLQGLYAEAFPKMGYQLIEGEYPEGPQSNPRKPIFVVSGEFTAYEFEDTKKKFDTYRWPETNENGEIIMEPFVDFKKDELILRSDKMEEDSPESTRFSREIKVVARIKEDWNKGYETSRGILMDIDDLKALEKEYIKVNKIKVSNRENKGYNRAIVKVASMDLVDPVETEIKAMGFETQSMETVRKPMQENTRKQQLFLGMMGGISLVVAAIGITNTMIMSIYERTREIGVMKVVGCMVSNIRTIFLMEAGVIGFFGGCFGVAISYAISFIMNYYNFSFSGNASDQGMMYGRYMRGGMEEGAATAVSIIPLWLVGAAILFATLVGLLSGIVPANRAMKISALEAIKHE